MGAQIVNQGNDRYAVWNDTVDEIVLRDATGDEVCEFFRRTREEGRAIDAAETIAQYRAGREPYAFPLSWNEAQRRHALLHAMP